MTEQPRFIYHMCRREEWLAALKRGVYRGSSQDEGDGFIHFSSAAQLRKSAEKHRAGQGGLVLLKVDPAKIGEGLEWEKARGGEYFPHLYAALPLDAVVRVDDLPLGLDGKHIFPHLD